MDLNCVEVVLKSSQRYSISQNSGLDINGCVELFWGDTVDTETLMNTVIQAVHSLFYIVAKCHFFSVVTWKDIIEYLQKCEGYTHLLLFL